jgi:uncharacterized membrane protein
VADDWVFITGVDTVMTKMLKGLIRGATAGAAGTTALNVVSGADAAVRGRPASSAPQELVARLAEGAGVEVPGSRGRRRNRIEALGPLAGAATGLVVGAVAMLATDLPLATTGVSDPKKWTRAEWTADVLPHLAYGITTHQTLVALSADHDDTVHASPARPATLLRASALGAASGARSTAGLTALAWMSRRGDAGVAGKLATGPGRGVVTVLAVGESAVDKWPSTPPRTAVQGVVPRIVSGASAAGGLATREGEEPGPAALIGAGAAVAAAWAGIRLRAAASRRFGSDLPGAFAEDLLAAALGLWGARRNR